MDNVLAKLATPGGLAAAARLIEIFDANNTTYLTHRRRGYYNRTFHALYFDGRGDADRRAGAAYLFSEVKVMAGEFMDIIAAGRRRLKTKT